MAGISKGIFGRDKCSANGRFLLIGVAKFGVSRRSWRLNFDHSIRIMALSVIEIPWLVIKIRFGTNALVGVGLPLKRGSVRFMFRHVGSPVFRLDLSTVLPEP
jgi:Na+-driven multidrug efflux pump